MPLCPSTLWRKAVAMQLNVSVHININIRNINNNQNYLLHIFTPWTFSAGVRWLGVLGPWPWHPPPREDNPLIDLISWPPGLSSAPGPLNQRWHCDCSLCSCVQLCVHEKGFRNEGAWKRKKKMDAILFHNVEALCLKVGYLALSLHLLDNCFRLCPIKNVPQRASGSGRLRFLLWHYFSGDPYFL